MLCRPTRRRVSARDGWGKGPGDARSRTSGFALSDGIGHGGGAVGGPLLPTVVASFSFLTGFVGIGITGVLAGLIALLGPRSSGWRLEEVSG